MKKGGMLALRRERRATEAFFKNNFRTAKLGLAIGFACFVKLSPLSLRQIPGVKSSYFGEPPWPCMGTEGPQSDPPLLVTVQSTMITNSSHSQPASAWHPRKRVKHELVPIFLPKNLLLQTPPQERLAWRNLCTLFFFVGTSSWISRQTGHVCVPVGLGQA